MKNFLRLILLTGTALALAANAAWAVENRNKRDSLLRQLKALPLRETPYSQIRRLVLPLVEIDPRRAKKYMLFSVYRMTNTDGNFVVHLRQLVSRASRIVRKSDLPESEIRRIVNKINDEYLHDDFFSATPTPTPAPDPTPRPTP